MTKRALIEQLIEITKLQTIALEKEDIDEYNRLLDERQVALDKIQVLHEVQPETKEQHEEELVTQLKAIDAQNRVEFEKQFEEVKKKLREVRAMKKREEHYNNPYDISWEEGVFFDKKERR
nr:hypothetical protein [uncultured Cellulosilyticum sp.]